jgi:hypothetical protein
MSFFDAGPRFAQKEAKIVANTPERMKIVLRVRQLR